MRKYIYNKDQFEFYTSDGSCVQAWQVESGNVWTLEIFPPNQTTESFESCQYSGGITFAPEGNEGEDEWYMKEYPETWIAKDEEEFKAEMQNQLDMVELRDTLECCSQ